MRRAPRPAVCVYCRRSAADGAEFGDEHVLPKMFGRFRGALTLQCVCKTCNGAFSSSFEERFGRDSAEGVLRLLFGLRAKSPARDRPFERAVLTYPERNVYQGAKVVIEADERGLRGIRFPLQVIFRHPGHDDPVALLEGELTPESIVPFKGRNEITILGAKSDAEVDGIVSRLRQCGWSETGSRENLQSPETPPQTPISIKSLIDDITRRAVAKIAFNYLAFVTGFDFASRLEFDDLRSAILHGSPSLAHRIISEARSIEMDRTRDRYGDGHVLVLHWFHVPGAHLVAEMSFFNRVTYSVRLARDVGVVWRPIHSAHHFDLRTMSVRAVPLRSPLALLPLPRLG